MGDLDKTLQAIASLCPKNIPELERLPVVELQVGDQCLLIWSEQKEAWRVKSFCSNGDVDIVCEKFNAHMAVPKNELRLVIDFQQSQIEQLEKQQRINSECINNLVKQKADYLHKVTMAIAHLDSFDHSRAGMNQLVRSIESALEALRGDEC